MPESANQIRLIQKSKPKQLHKSDYIKTKIADLISEIARRIRNSRSETNTMKIKTRRQNKSEIRSEKSSNRNSIRREIKCRIREYQKEQDVTILWYQYINQEEKKEREGWKTYSLSEFSYYHDINDSCL